MNLDQDEDWFTVDTVDDEGFVDKATGRQRSHSIIHGKSSDCFLEVSGMVQNRGIIYFANFSVHSGDNFWN
jgi:hypothetical protein